MLTFKQFMAEAYPNMKKKDADPYYYHITQGKNMPGIAKHGLKRRKAGKNYSDSVNHGPRSVFLGTHSNDSKQFAQDLAYGYDRKGNEQERSMRMIRVHKDKLDPKKFARDRNFWGLQSAGIKPKKGTNRYEGKGVPGAWEYRGDIPAKDIEFSGGKHYRKGSKKWKDALTYYVKSLAEAYPNMKKKDADPYYYHITPGRNMSKIGTEGLKSSGRGRRKNYSYSGRNRTYLATSREDAEKFANDMAYKAKHTEHSSTYTDKKQSLRMIRVHKDKLDPKKIHRDRNYMDAEKVLGHDLKKKPPRTWEYHGDIPAKDIDFKGGGHYKKDSKAWKDVRKRSQS